MKVLMFPGQGAQFRGMGRDLFDAWPELVEQADGILGYSIRRLCLEDPERQLANTRFTQPAIFVASALAYRQFVADGGDAAFAVGHSLGEYSALYAAGMLDFDSALRLVKRRAELMADIHGGAMCAVIGLGHHELLTRLEAAGLDIDVANHNTQTQLVLSGPAADIARAETVLAAPGNGLRVVRLRVSGAFHSRMMQSASAEFARSLCEVDFAEPEREVIANCSVAAYTRETAASLLARQLVSPVRWFETVVQLLDRGASEFVELGPGEVLGRLLADIRRQRPVTASAPPPVVEHGPDGRPSPIEGATAQQPTGTPSPSRFEARWQARSSCVAGCIGNASSPELLAALASAGIVCFAPTRGLAIDRIEAFLHDCRARVAPEHHTLLGLNVTAEPSPRSAELLALAERLDLGAVEVSGFRAPDDALLRFRARSAGRRRILVKVRSLAAARSFLQPPPYDRIDRLIQANGLGAEDREILATAPPIDALCLDGSLWQQSPRSCLATATEQLQALATLAPDSRIDLGVAGGIGDRAAYTAAKAAGADFVLLGSVLQLACESALSDTDRSLLAATPTESIWPVLDGESLAFGLQTAVARECNTLSGQLDTLRRLLHDIGDGARIEESVRQRTASASWPSACPSGDEADAWRDWIQRTAASLSAASSERLAASPAATNAARRWQSAWPHAAALVREITGKSMPTHQPH